MTKHAKSVVLDALDKIALALSRKNHKWSQAERRAYETAVRLLS